MANFCGKCGSPLDKKTGLCPQCDRRRTSKGKRFLFIAGMLLVAAVLLWNFSSLLKKPEIPPLPDIPTNTANSTEMELQNERKLVRIERYQDDGGMELLYELSYGENGSISNITVWSFGKDGEQVLERIYPIEYDAAGRVIRNGIMEQGSYNGYKYNEEGLLVYSVGIEGGQANTNYTYDEYGRLKQSVLQSDQINTTVTYQYDKAGNILLRTERNEYSFGTVEERTYHYQYNREKQLSSIISDNSETHYAYDSQGRIREIVTQDDTGSSTMQYRYDFVPFVICTQTQEIEDENILIRFATADICDIMDHKILSVHIGRGVPQMDDEGYLTQVRSEEEGFTIKFLYE